MGISGEWLFIFRELGSTGYYFMGVREQAHNFWDLGSLAKKQKNKEKPPFCLIFKKFPLLLGGGGGGGGGLGVAPQTPLVNSK